MLQRLINKIFRAKARINGKFKSFDRTFLIVGGDMQNFCLSLLLLYFKNIIHLHPGRSLEESHKYIQNILRILTKKMTKVSPYKYNLNFLVGTKHLLQSSAVFIWLWYMHFIKDNNALSLPYISNGQF